MHALDYTSDIIYVIPQIYLQVRIRRDYVRRSGIGSEHVVVRLITDFVQQLSGVEVV